MVGTDRETGHVGLLWESVIAHLGLSVRPRWLPDTRDDHDLCGGSSGLIAALTASASSRLTGTSIVIRTTILSPLMAPSVSADPHQSDPVEMGWQSCGDLALIDLVLAMGYGHTAEVIEALFSLTTTKIILPVSREQHLLRVLPRWRSSSVIASAQACWFTSTEMKPYMR